MVVSAFMLDFQKNFSIFSLYVLVLICRRGSNKQGNISFDLVGLVLLSNCQSMFRCASSPDSIILLYYGSNFEIIELLREHITFCLSVCSFCESSNL